MRAITITAARHARRAMSTGASACGAPDLGARLPALQQFFPNSFEAGTCAPVANDILAAKGFLPDLTLFSTSVCPDEINTDCPEFDISNTLERHWGEIFPLGGLGGIPFAGKTGWGAFAAHVPVGGDIFLLFGPHCGLSFEGEPGYVQRRGQPKPSTCCGAAVAALNTVEGGGGVPAADPFDMQQSYLNATTERRIDEIRALGDQHGDLMVGMTHMLYDEIQVYLRNIANMGFGGRLAVLGGIQVNLSDPHRDRFMPMTFEMCEQDGTVTDLMGALVPGTTSKSLFPLNN